MARPGRRSTTPVTIGKARVGSRSGKRIGGYSGRIESGPRGGLTDDALAAGSRGHGRSAPGTGFGGGPGAGGGDLPGNGPGGGQEETTNPPGGGGPITDPTPQQPSGPSPAPAPPPDLFMPPPSPVAPMPVRRTAPPTVDESGFVALKSPTINKTATSGGPAINRVLSGGPATGLSDAELVYMNRARGVGTTQVGGGGAGAASLKGSVKDASLVGGGGAAAKAPPKLAGPAALAKLTATGGGAGAKAPAAQTVLAKLAAPVAKPVAKPVSGQATLAKLTSKPVAKATPKPVKKPGKKAS